MQILNFIPPRYDSFLRTIRSFRDEGVTDIHLNGRNFLADRIAAAAEEENLLLTRTEAPLKTHQMKNFELLIFTETSGELLSAQLLECIGLERVVIVAPVTDRHFSRKPLFIVSIPKSGTHLVYELAHALGYQAGVEVDEFPRGQRWYCVEYSNSHTVARDFFVEKVRRSPFGNRHHPFMQSPALFIFRHPLDILISEANYYHLDGKTPFSGWLNQYDLSERMDRLLCDRWMLGPLRERIGGFLPWLEFPNVIPFSFEELIGSAGGGNKKDQLRLIWSIQLKLQVPGNPEEIASHLFNPNSPTFRSGQIGEYMKLLSAEFIDEFCRKNSDILEELGYPLDGSFDFPDRKEQRLKKMLLYSRVNYDSMPITVESGFLDCNFVRYKKRIYALPRAAGPVDLTELTSATLAHLPAADSVEDLKILLTLGCSDMLQRQKELNRLALILSAGEPLGNSCHYWNQNRSPVIVETYKSYNIISCSNRYIALRQSAGIIDLVNNDMDAVLSSHGSDNVITSASISELHNRIDEFITLQRLQEEVAALRDQTFIKINALQEEAGRLAERLGDQISCHSRSATQTMEELKQQIVIVRDSSSVRIDAVQEEIKRLAEQTEQIDERLTVERQVEVQSMEELRQEIRAVNHKLLPESQSGFLDCNFVMYREQFYALPRAAGPIDIDQLSSHALDLLPSAHSVEELKALLTSGYSDLMERREAINRLAEMLCKGEGGDNLHLYWKESNSPYILDCYKGYNIIAYRGHYLALKQTAGKIDLAGNTLEDLVQNYNIDDVLIGLSISGLHHEIDGLSISQRSRLEAAEFNNEVVKEIENIRNGFKDNTNRINSIDAEISEIHQEAEDALLQYKQESAAADKQIWRKIEIMQVDCEEKGRQINRMDARITESDMASEESFKRLIEMVSVADKEAMTRIDRLESKQAEVIRQIAEHGNQLSMVKSNWLIRLSGVAGKILRRHKRNDP